MARVRLQNQFIARLLKVLISSPLESAWQSLESKLVGDFDAPFRLKDRLEPFRKEYSVIIIDTPPTLGLITVNALVAAIARFGSNPVVILRARRNRRSPGDNREG